ncbi:DUF4003 family protein [Clostridium perfringens]|uniref:DUF4003 family protein n=1 Tax=Clostridium perfringens TaxID=1502 RepID=UPI0024BC4B14|nr:DUF4003 family protein [Clostridium perfringens]
MISERVDLLINNGEILDEIEGTSERNIDRKYSALNLTLRNEIANIDRIEKAIKLIKENTSAFSEYRRRNLLNLAVNISLEEDMDKALSEIKNIYINLKSEFSQSRYLMLAAEEIFFSRNFINVEEVIMNTKTAYKYMKKNHRFETKREDLCSAAMIAMTSENLEETFDEINECYDILTDCGFSKNNDLELLSNVLSIINMPVDIKCAQVRDLATNLKENKVEFKKSYLPILGIAAFVTDDYNRLSKNVLDVSETLKENEGFRSVTVDEKARNIMALILVVKEYLDNLKDDSKLKIIKKSSDKSLETVFAIASSGSVTIEEVDITVTQ